MAAARQHDHCLTGDFRSNEDQPGYDVHDILKAYDNAVIRDWVYRVVVGVVEISLLGPAGFIGMCDGGSLLAGFLSKTRLHCSRKLRYMLLFQASTIEHKGHNSTVGECNSQLSPSTSKCVTINLPVDEA